MAVLGLDQERITMKDLISRVYRGKGGKRLPRSLNIYRYADWCCEKCGAQQNLTKDHIVPRSMGGVLAQCNLQVLCKQCNEEKGATIKLFTQRKKARRYVRQFTGAQVLTLRLGEQLKQQHNRLRHVLGACFPMFDGADSHA